jgi:hypothetical protein
MRFFLHEELCDDDDDIIWLLKSIEHDVGDSYFLQSMFAGRASRRGVSQG